MSYGTDFINALNSGLNTGDTMRRRNALMGAGRMAAGGDAKSGMNALLGAGMIEEAGQFRQIGEDQRREQYRGAVTQGLQSAGNDYRKQLQALSGAAAQFGDADQVLRSSELLQGMDDRQRQQWGEVNDAFGSLSVGLVSSKVPEAERKARALAAAPQIAQRTGMDVAQVTQMIQSTQDWSDQGLLASARNNMTAADAVQEYTRQGERQQDIEHRTQRESVQDRQWAAEFGEQRRARRAAEEAAMVRAMGSGQSGGVSVDPETGALTVTGGPALKEQEAKFGLYASQANDALRALQEMENAGFDKGDPASGIYQAVRNAGIPVAAPNLGRDVTDWIPGTQRNRQYEFQTTRFLDGWARAMTGAAMTREETDMYKRMLMPQPGEGAEVLAQKRAARERMAQDLVGAAGRGGRIAATPTAGAARPTAGSANQGAADPMGIR